MFTYCVNDYVTRKKKKKSFEHLFEFSVRMRDHITYFQTMSFLSKSFKNNFVSLYHYANFTLSVWRSRLVIGSINGSGPRPKSRARGQCLFLPGCVCVYLCMYLFPGYCAVVTVGTHVD